MAVSFGKDMTTITNERHLANTATANGAIEILLASGTPHLPQVTGGLQVNTDDLALELNARRISTAVLNSAFAEGSIRAAVVLPRWPRPSRSGSR